MTDNTFNVPANASIRILSEDGRWTEAKPLGAFWAKPAPSPYEYPTTARRAFVNLAEAVRTIDEAGYSRRILEALAGLHVNDLIRFGLVHAFVEHAAADRLVLAGAFADILDGQEKFHTGRFVHHATSDSDADDDGEAGKWSYNRLHPEDAQKTTIEPEDDGGEMVVIL